MTLPSNEENKFTGLLKNLSEEKEKLGIINFGLSVTTLEDVFLKVGESITANDNPALELEVTNFILFINIRKVM